MGGTGSGRWVYYDKKRTVEECWAINVSDVARAVDLRDPGRSSGYLLQLNAAARKTAVPVLCTTEVGDDGAPILGLFYTVGGRSGTEHRVEDAVRLLTTRPNFGGVRWWFSCPRMADGEECGRRVGKLYRPPGGQRFGCRLCLDLTYESCQRSHTYDGLWKLMSAGDPKVEGILKEYSSTIARGKRQRARVGSLPLLDAFDEAFGMPAAKHSPSRD